MRKEKNVAIVLAAGQGRRMKTSVPKQYLLLGGRPVLFYSLEIFQKSEVIDEIILVVEQEKIDYCRNEFIEKYRFSKITKVIAGGKERYLSVYCGIKEAEAADNIFVHDGARPFITQDIIERSYEAVQRYDACAVGVPVKDTIKVIDENGFVVHTPDRNYMWAVQTPQVFKYELLHDAYQKLMSSKEQGITDDAMVVERMLDAKVKLVQGDYKNIKITTQEDLLIGEQYLASV